MREIVDGVYTWSRLSEPHGYDFNGYLVELPEGAVVIDPVEPDAASLAEIVARRPRRILLTNRNHSRAANRLREATGAQTAIHPDDAGHATAQGTEIDAALALGEDIGPLAVLDAAGKSPGEVALYWRARRLLFVGDVVVGWPAGACKLLPEDKLDDPARLRDSVRRLAALPVDSLLVGDGVPILRDADRALQRLVDQWPA